MVYWLTYHWAHPDPDDLPWYVYRKRLTARDKEAQPGDGVVFFQGARPRAAGGRMTHATRVQSGKRQAVPLVDAAPGLVCSGVVVGPWREIAPADIVYDYGNLPSWHFLLPCRTEVRGGPVGLKEVQRVLGSKRPPHTFGLVPLDPHQFAKLIGLLQSGG